MKLGRAVEFLKGLCRARHVIDRHAVIGSRVFLELIPVHLGRQSGSPFLSSPLPPPLPLYPFPRKEGNGTGEKESLSTFRWRLRIRRTFDINYRIIPLMLYPRVKAADRRTLRSLLFTTCAWREEQNDVIRLCRGYDEEPPKSEVAFHYIPSVLTFRN